MSGKGKVNYKKLWQEAQARIKPPTGVPIEMLEWERQFNLLMLTREEREYLAELSPETRYVMGV